MKKPQLSAPRPQPAPARALFHLWIKRILGITALVALLIAAVIATAEIYTSSAARGRICSSAQEIPDGDHSDQAEAVGLVLGCSPYIGSVKNLYFVHRITAAAELWKSGKVSALIVSGDNKKHNYNEPREMKRALIKAGVPANRIICDYAGLRTLDSVVRASKIFQAKRLIIISQLFHNKRALAIARHHNIEACALNATEVKQKRLWLRSFLRERAARACMILDLWLLDTQPRHLGEPVPLPSAEDESAVLPSP